MTSAIRLENLTFGYDRHPAVHHLKGEFKVGSLTAIVCPNGAGKSTLLKGLMRMIQPLDDTFMLMSVKYQKLVFAPTNTARRQLPYFCIRYCMLGVLANFRAIWWNKIR
jgi:ABC-type cobalamin/Fe3+-siderophores transport system ATPase subunit